MLMLCLLTMPLLAQETPKPEKSEFDALLEKLKEASPEDRERLLEELRKLVKDKFEASTTIQVRDITLDLDTRSGQEKMTGSWKEANGVSGDYVITGLGNSRYRLEAVQTGAEGEVTKIKDEGTLAELHKKYPFMKSFAFITMVAPDAPFQTTSPLKGRILRGTPRAELVWPPAAKTDSVLGITVRRPSKDLEYHLKLATETAWIVEDVLPGSKGAKVGLKKMDLLTEADGEDLSELKALRNARKSLTVLRRGKTIRISLGESKEK
jgi:hypothetical protein